MARLGRPLLHQTKWMVETQATSLAISHCDKGVGMQDKLKSGMIGK